MRLNVWDPGGTAVMLGKDLGLTRLSLRVSSQRGGSSGMGSAIVGDEHVGPPECLAVPLDTFAELDV